MALNKILCMFTFTLLAAAGLRAEPAVPGLYQQYKPVATAVPTPSAADASMVHLNLQPQTYSILLKGGVDMSLGQNSDLHSLGTNGGLEFIYGATPKFGVAVFTEYNSVPYNLTTAAQPEIAYGLGLRALYQFLEASGVKVYVEGGIGGYVVNRASDVFVSTNVYKTVYVQAGGFGFNGGLALSYPFNPHFALRAAADITRVSLNGGTGEQLLTIDPNIGILYTF